MSDKENLILGALLHDIGKFWERARKKDDMGRPVENLFPEFSYERVGKIDHGHARWSAQFIKENEHLFSEPETIIDLVLYHSNPFKEKVKDKIEVRFIALADWLSSMERRLEDEYIERTGRDLPERWETPCVSIFNEVDLGQGKVDKVLAYDLRALESKREIVFPQKEYPSQTLSKDAYTTLRDKDRGLRDELKNVGKDDFITLYYLLQKYLWAVPSATPYEKEKRFPDISLFDHLKTTAAIAICLYECPKLYDEKFLQTLMGALRKWYRMKKDPRKGIGLDPKEKKALDEPLFYLLSADVSGIQDFIYSISQPEAVPGVAKRLRGRSFYLSIMTEVFARHLLRTVDFPITNMLYCGGGNFDIILPKNEGVNERIDKAIKEINDYLLKNFYGDLRLIITKHPLSCKELDEYDEVLKKIYDDVSIAKKKKFIAQLREDLIQNILPKDMHEEKLRQKNPQVRIDLCLSCNRVPVDADLPPEEKICELCKKHKEIGEILPKSNGIIFASGEIQLPSFKKEEFVGIDFGKFGQVYLIAPKAKDKQIEIEGSEAIKIEYLAINQTEGFCNRVDISKPNISAGFRFIGNIAPQAKEAFPVTYRQESHKKGDVLDFETIAHLSIGDKRLGILKMDIDYLSLIFGIGLSKDNVSDRTISRIATLSRMFDLFFTGYLNNICNDLFNKWRVDPHNDCDFKEKISNIFYITYSGGDDLLIVGPWSEIIKLSLEINNEFRKFTCQNPNITLSSGIFLCRPKFPVKRFAPLVGEILEQSKIKGRNRNSAFGDTVRWEREDGYPSFSNLLSFGEQLFEAVNAEEPRDRLPRGFVYRLLQLRNTRFDDRTQIMDLRYIPELIYSIVRNVKRQANIEVAGRRENLKDYLWRKLINNLFGSKIMEKIRIPASYALLKSRKEE